MNKQFTKALALGLAAMMVLGGCGGASTETKAAEEASQKKPNSSRSRVGPEAKRELTEVVIPKIASTELETFNFLHSQRFRGCCGTSQPVGRLIDLQQPWSILGNRR